MESNLHKIVPVEKLIDVIQQGVGRLTKSYFTKKDIENELYKQRKLNEIELEKLSTTKLIENQQLEDKIRRIANLRNELSLNGNYESEGLKLQLNEITENSTLLIDNRATERIAYKNIIEQENVENITSFATKEILSTESVSGEKISKDWIYKFFKLAEQVSEEEMQIIWGKILAGEVKKPNSFSIRTLEILSSLTQNDALIFSKLANFAISDNIYPIAYIFHKKHMDEFNKNELGLIYSDIMIMEDIGLISTSKSFISYKYQEYKRTEIIVGNNRLEIEIREQAKEQRFPAKGFTRTGTELLRLIDKTASNEYIENIISYVGRCGNKCRKI